MQTPGATARTEYPDGMIDAKVETVQQAEDHECQIPLPCQIPASAIVIRSGNAIIAVKPPAVCCAARLDSHPALDPPAHRLHRDWRI